MKISILNEIVSRAGQRIAIFKSDPLRFTNLFKLRDYAFRNPQEIEKKLKDLRKWDWNDGEVAEVYSQILSQVSYLIGKQVVLKKLEGEIIK